MISEATKRGGSLTERAFWLMFAKTLGFVFSFALPLLLVRRLNQTEYGLYKQVFLVVTTSLAVFPLGFGMSAFYFLPREHERQGAVVFNIMLLNFAVGGLACLTLLIAPQVLAGLFGSAELVPYAPLVGFIILFWLVSAFLEIVAIANQEAKQATMFIIIAQFTKTALLLAAATAFASIESLLWAALIQGILQTIVLFGYLHSRFAGFWRRFDWPLMGLQLSYALPIGLGGLIFAVLMDLHNYFVSHRFGAATFALYSVGCFSLPLVGIIGESVGAVMILRVSQLQKQGDSREIVLLTARVMRKLAALYFPLYVFLIVVGREFIILLFTARYLDSWPVFVINLTMLPTLILIVDPIMRAHAEHRFFLLKVRAVTVVVLFVALWFTTGYFGMVGAISIMVTVTLIDRLIETGKAWRIIGVTPRDIVLLKDVGKIGLAALLAGVAAAGARSLVLGLKPFFVLLLCGVVFAPIYIACTWLFGVVTLDERDFLLRHWAVVQRRTLWRRAENSLV
ncbi:MAG: oligosaccharide flippase family protein [Pyrinomonadaceae bacterium]